MNEIVLEARKRDYSETVLLLRAIRRAYIALHQGTMAAPTALSASTGPYDGILLSPSSYPLCTLACHRSDSTLDGPHSPQVEPQPLPAITAVNDISIISEANPVHAAAQRAEETIITHSPTITPSDDTSPETAPFPSASQTTELAHLFPQVTSVPYPSILTRDLKPLVPTEDSQKPPQSTLKATETAIPSDPTKYIYTAERRETSHTAAATSLHFPHPDPILATDAPPTPPALPSSVVSRMVDTSNAFQCTTLATALSRPEENNKEPDTTMPSTTPCITEISSTAHSIPQSIPAGCETLEGDEEATEVPPIVVSHSQSSHMPMPAPPRNLNVIPEELSSFMESPLIQSDSTSHALRSPSSLATARSQSAPQVTPILDAHVTGGIQTSSGHGDTQGMDTRIPIEDLPHPDQSSVQVTRIDPDTLPPEPEHGRNGRN